MGRKIPNVAKKSLQRAKCVVVAGANLLNLFQIQFANCSCAQYDEDDFVLRLDFWNDDLDEGWTDLELDVLKLLSKSGKALNLLSNPEPKPEASESSFISL